MDETPNMNTDPTPQPTGDAPDDSPPAAASPASPPPSHRRVWIARARFAVVVALLVLVGYWLFELWKEQIEDRVIAKRWGVVHEGQIYRSGQLSESLVDRMLEDNQIAVVIDMTGLEKQGHPDRVDQDAELAAVERLGIEHGRYPLGGDGKGDPLMYERALRELATAVRDGDPVLVHCAAGAHRTGGMIATWRLLVDGWEPEAIVDEMGDYDWRTYDKHGLLPYLDEHMPRFAVVLHEAGAIEEVPDTIPKLSPAAD